MCHSGRVPTADIDPELIDDSKDSLRADVRARRRAMSAQTRHDAAQGIRHQVLDIVTTLELGVADRVAAYASRADEPGTAPALEAIASHGVGVLLPVLGPGLERDWGLYDGPGSLAERAPGRPPEPAVRLGGPAELGSAAVVLAPALTVDAEGYRVGQGAGWYDRALAHARPDALVVAVVFDHEVSASPLPRAPHDVPVHAICTPSCWWRIAA